MYIVRNASRQQAPPALRDWFLFALDQRDDAAVREIAGDLRGCVNLLPTLTCIQLGLTPGSTYGDAAEAVTKPPSSVLPAEGA